MTRPRSGDHHINTIRQAVAEAATPFGLTEASAVGLAEEVTAHLHANQNRLGEAENLPLDRLSALASELALDMAFSDPVLRKEMNYRHALDNIR